MINPWYLANNIVHSMRVCPAWKDRWYRLLWLYGDKRRPVTPVRQHRIHFRYKEPIGVLDFVVRENRGADAFIFGEVFDHHYYKLPLSRLPTTILDLGTNTGFTPVYFARLYPDAAIACVEPVPENLDLLRQNLRLNGVPAVVVPAAIATEDGRSAMSLASKDYGHKVAGIPFGASFDGRLIWVEAVSVPTLLRQLKWSRVGLLKIDIEGYEGILLKQKCEWLRQVDAICIECHEGYGREDLTALARDWGFRVPQALSGIWYLEREN